jgi:hypothetical protein
MGGWRLCLARKAVVDREDRLWSEDGGGFAFRGVHARFLIFIEAEEFSCG